MARQSEAPQLEVRSRPHGMEDDVYTHPAFGVITLHNYNGGNDVLFGSDLTHSNRVGITISRAEHHRGLSNDWHHERERLIEVEMSHAQFAQFITSQGKGGGTPVTLRYAAPRNAGLEMIPAIKQIESKASVLRREIKEAAAMKTQHVAALIEKFGQMAASGKIGIKDAKALHHSLKCAIENLPGNVAFVVEQAEEALEKATNDAKIQIEAYADQVVRRVGLENIGQLSLQNISQQDPNDPHTLDFPAESQVPSDTCSKCGHAWEEHEFGVPAPYCPEWKAPN